MTRLTREQARAYRAAMLKGAAILTDAEALNTPLLFPRWAVGVEYQTDDRLCYEGDLYKVLQNHTSQANWTPDVAVSLYVKIDDPSIEWPEWHQPAGAHDAYMAGDKVSHNDKHWISDVDNNVWEPGVSSWTEAVNNE